MPLLPLFPLGTVLFPGSTLPLHIFEPRYVQLISECLSGGSTFGVVLILEGEEVGSPAIPHRVGTEAAIVEARGLPQGRYDIAVHGQRRFEIKGLRHERPYTVAEVEWLPRGGGGSQEAVEVARALMEEFLRRLRGPLPGGIKGLAALDDEGLSFVIADLLPVEPDLKQELLEAPTPALRLDLETRILMEALRPEGLGAMG
jgi:hypothetical protein